MALIHHEAHSRFVDGYGEEAHHGLHGHGLRLPSLAPIHGGVAVGDKVEADFVVDRERYTFHQRRAQARPGPRSPSPGQRLQRAGVGCRTAAGVARMRCADLQLDSRLP